MVFVAGLVGWWKKTQSRMSEIPSYYPLTLDHPSSMANLGNLAIVRLKGTQIFLLHAKFSCFLSWAHKEKNNPDSQTSVECWIKTVEFGCRKLGSSRSTGSSSSSPQQVAIFLGDASLLFETDPPKAAEKLLLHCPATLLLQCKDLWLSGFDLCFLRRFP